MAPRGKAEEIVPPEPIMAYLYEVDNHFRLEPLREMLRDQKVAGLIAMDSKEASFGILNGERFELIENITSGIHGSLEKADRAKEGTKENATWQSHTFSTGLRSMQQRHFLRTIKLRC